MRLVVVTAAAVVTVALTARLGVWQLDRAAQKTGPAGRDRPAGSPAGAGRRVATARRRRPRWLRRTIAARAWPAAGRPPHRVPGQPPDERPPGLLRRHAAAAGRRPRRAGATRLGCRATRSTARALPPVTTPAGRGAASAGASPRAPARSVRVRVGAASGAIRQNLDLDAFARETGLRLRPLSRGADRSRPRRRRRAAARLAAPWPRRRQAPRLCLPVVRLSALDRRSVCLVPIHPTPPTPRQLSRCS